MFKQILAKLISQEDSEAVAASTSSFMSYFTLLREKRKKKTLRLTDSFSGRRSCFGPPGARCQSRMIECPPSQFTLGRCWPTWWAAWPGSAWTRLGAWTSACPSSGSWSSHRAPWSAGTGHSTELSGELRRKRSHRTI